MANCNHEWVYKTEHAKWQCIKCFCLGNPKKDDWYSDAGEWRIW